MTGDWGYVALGASATVILTVASFAIGSILGVGLLLLQVSFHRPAAWIGSAYVELVRAVPPIVWIFLIFFGLPELGIRLQPFVACVIALSLISASYLSEIFRAGLSAVDRGQWEASQALGIGSAIAVRVVIAPQVIRAALPAMTTYCIGLLKDSSLASIVGVAELTFRAGTEAQRTGSALSAYAFIGVLYMVLSFTLAAIGRRIEASMAESRAQR